MSSDPHRMRRKIGCCGFPVAQAKYFQHFNVIELQKTFYQPPLLRTVEKWRAEAPEDFEFTLKAWQLITHEPTSPTYRRLTLSIPDTRKKNYGFFKPTREVLEAWEDTSAVAAILKANIIVFQCPASFKPTDQNKSNMREFFAMIERRNFQFVWEPRGPWSPDEIQELCQELDLIHCVDPFKGSPTWGKTRYFRLHGKTGYRYKYSDEDLEELNTRTKEELPTYVMFNNVPMFEDALRFIKLIGR